ncbi:MAG TPA: helix-turn-helix domain-containing protein [Cyclobacteriaceae bacterium]|nr:helix-turn-helix domain-containing protein [Cyclobacteriaceae bacterium]
MSEPRSADSEFLDQVIVTIGDNMHDEQFGVTELADKMNMSRSNLLLKVKKAGVTSVNQVIKEVRLKRAMDLLRTSQLNVSEVSHKVGFNSSSYFIKCFREYYGYPPGEAGKKTAEDIKPLPVAKPNRRILPIVVSIVSIVALVAVAVVWFSPSGTKTAREKSVLVLPFKNESNDSTNLYLINGLMESTLNNLQKIEDLRVLSRTSAEKYRNSQLSIPEMAKELNVQYFVEGSGQKIGDQILLNIQLIEGPTDKHLWAKQYRREAKDIFELQQEIAKNIAVEIQAIITPDEQRRIEEKPTENLVAYDLYLKGANEWTAGTRESLTKAIPFFKQAVEQDDKFAIAYAALAVSYYYLDIFQFDKKYGTEINSYSDKALLLDPQNPTCLISKAMYYMHQYKPVEAVPYLEKALEFNPNSAQALNFLSDIYNFYLPNTSKHLYNALKATRLNVGLLDSATAGLNYMHLSAAFVQAGFNDEAQTYINKSYAYDPNNMFVGWLKAAIMITKTNDFAAAKDFLVSEYEKDTTRLHLLQEIGKLDYVMHDYEGAYRYFEKFNRARTAYNLDIFHNIDLTIGIVYIKVGKKEEGEKYIRQFADFAENDKTIYKPFFLSMYYAWKNDPDKSLGYLKAFSEEDNFQYWVLLLESDELVDDLRDKPEFKAITKKISDKFWDNNKKIRRQLEKDGLI